MVILHSTLISYFYLCMQFMLVLLWYISPLIICLYFQPDQRCPAFEQHLSSDQDLHLPSKLLWAGIKTHDQVNPARLKILNSLVRLLLHRERARTVWHKNDSAHFYHTWEVHQLAKLNIFMMKLSSSKNIVSDDVRPQHACIHCIHWPVAW